MGEIVDEFSWCAAQKYFGKLVRINLRWMASGAGCESSIRRGYVEDGEVVNEGDDHACVTILDLASLNPRLVGFRRGFTGTDNTPRYGYLTPAADSVAVRVDLEGIFCLVLVAQHLIGNRLFDGNLRWLTQTLDCTRWRRTIFAAPPASWQGIPAASNVCYFLWQSARRSVAGMTGVLLMPCCRQRLGVLGAVHDVHRTCGRRALQRACRRRPDGAALPRNACVHQRICVELGKPSSGKRHFDKFGSHLGGFNQEGCAVARLLQRDQR